MFSVKFIAIFLLLAGSQDEGRAKAERGAEAFSAGRYEEAIREFSEAYPLFPDARVLFNLAFACDRAGRKRDALEAYRLFDQKLQGASREDLATIGNARIAAARKRARQLETELGNPPATTSEGGAQQKEEPAASPLASRQAQPAVLPLPPNPAPPPHPGRTLAAKNHETSLLPTPGKTRPEVAALAGQPATSLWPRWWVVALGAAAVVAGTVVAVSLARHDCRGDLQCF